MELQELMKNSSDLHVIIPQGSVDSMEMNRFSVLLLSKSLLSFAVEKGRIIEVIGHDGVYKVTEQGVPINLYTTVTHKEFRGIVLGYSIASQNCSTIKALIQSFLLYLQETYPIQYQRPMFSVDEEESQINALLQLQFMYLQISSKEFMEKAHCEKSTCRIKRSSCYDHVTPLGYKKYG